ncbi:MAG: hypothetical protein WA888_14595, partial [Burkholderiaceae bacterium]
LSTEQIEQPEIDKEPEQPEDTRPRRSDLEVTYRDAQRRKARADFDKRDTGEQTTIVSDFEREFVSSAPQIIRRSYSKGGLDQPAIRTEFNQWYAQRLWGADWAKSSSDDLLNLLTRN